MAAGPTEPSLCVRVIISHLNYTHEHGAIEAAKEATNQKSSQAHRQPLITPARESLCETVCGWEEMTMMKPPPREMSCNMECRVEVHNNHAHPTLEDSRSKFLSGGRGC